MFCSPLCISFCHAVLGQRDSTFVSKQCHVDVDCCRIELCVRSTQATLLGCRFDQHVVDIFSYILLTWITTYPFSKHIYTILFHKRGPAIITPCLIKIKHLSFLALLNDVVHSLSRLIQVAVLQRHHFPNHPTTSSGSPFVHLDNAKKFSHSIFNSIGM